MRDRIKLFVLGALFVFCSIDLIGQNNTSSPYSRYGLNTTENTSYSQGNGMGGVGIALRDHYYINPMNPASYSVIDSMSFLVEAGFFGKGTSFNDGKVRESAVNANFQYFAMSFPLWKKMGSSIGMKPYAVVGYDYAGIDSVSQIGAYQSAYSGGGSINQAYWANAYQPTKNISLGFSMNYLFGKIYHDENVSFADPTIMSGSKHSELYLHNLQFNFGLQYMQDIGKDKHLTVGLTLTPNVNASSTYENKTYSAIDTITAITEQQAKLPAQYGVGFALSNSKWIISADVLREMWKNSYFMNVAEAMDDKTKISAGFQYLNDPFSRNLFKRMRYRGGVHYTDSNIMINGVSLKEFGVSGGFGIPVRSLATTLNVALELGRRGSTNNGLVEESYAKVMISFALYDSWFYKRRFK